MTNSTNFRDGSDDRGISPLVGGILMVALVILMAALIFVYSNGLLSENTTELAGVTFEENPKEGTVTADLVSMPQSEDRVLLVHGDTLETLDTLSFAGQSTDVVPPADARILIMAVNDEDENQKSVIGDYDPGFPGTEVGFSQDSDDNVDVTWVSARPAVEEMSIKWEEDGSTQTRTIDNRGDTITIQDSEISNGTVIYASERPSGTEVNDYTYTTDSSTTTQSFSTAPNCTEDVTYRDEDDDGYWDVDTVYKLQCINEFGLRKNYELTEDIEAGGTSQWNDGKGFAPVGYYDYSNRRGDLYSGNFEGRGYTVEGLYINRPDTDYVGLFGFVDGTASINSVTLQDSSVTGRSRVGSLVGSKLRYSNIDNSSASGDVEGTGAAVGGLVGYSYGGTIDNSSASVDVTAGYDQAGGLVGHTGRTTIDNSSASGDVTAGGQEAGGLVGNHGGTIDNSSASGDVEGTTEVGGLVGENYGGTIDNSYSTSNISGDEGVGGLAGAGSEGADITNSYHAGSLDATQNTGGIVPSGDVTVTDSYWDEDKSNADMGAGGTPLSTEEMQGSSAEDNMNLDFNNTWRTTDSYPELQAEG